MQEHCIQLPLFPVEEWRPVVGFEDRYSVSSCGRIRSEQTIGSSQAGQVRKLHVNPKTGYTQVGLSRSGSGFTLNVHQLVARAFHGPRPAGWDIDHRDGVKANNSATNLEYVTRQENVAREHRMGLTSRGTARWNARMDPDTVRAIRASTASLGELADKYKINKQTICKIRLRQIWKHVE